MSTISGQYFARATLTRTNFGFTQLTFIVSKSRKETLEKRVTYA